MKKKLVYLCMLSLLSVCLLAGCGKKENKDNPNYNSDNYLSGTHYALMDVKDYGQIYLELYADKAPATVTNFVNLVNNGFYDGLTFHHIIKDFMIQGGDPEGNGTGGSTYTIPGEFATNGFDNNLSHLRGTLSMARISDDPNSASSQFFIVHQDSTRLDGYYAAFGHVIHGMEIVDSLCNSTPIQDENGTVLLSDQPIITYITMITKDQIPIVKVEEVPRPEPITQISVIRGEVTQDFHEIDRWVVNEDGENYLLSSTEELLSFALYEIDLTQSLAYGENNMLAYSSNVGANDFISLQINITTEGYPNQLLVAEEHNGALSMYLISYDFNNNTAYLIPYIY